MVRCIDWVVLNIVYSHRAIVARWIVIRGIPCTAEHGIKDGRGDTRDAFCTVARALGRLVPSDDAGAIAYPVGLHNQGLERCERLSDEQSQCNSIHNFIIIIKNISIF